MKQLHSSLFVYLALRWLQRRKGVWTSLSCRLQYSVIVRQDSFPSHRLFGIPWTEFSFAFCSMWLRGPCALNSEGARSELYPLLMTTSKGKVTLHPCASANTVFIRHQNGSLLRSRRVFVAHPYSFFSNDSNGRVSENHSQPCYRLPRLVDNQ